MLRRAGKGQCSRVSVTGLCASAPLRMGNEEEYPGMELGKKREKKNERTVHVQYRIFLHSHAPCRRPTHACLCAHADGSSWVSEAESAKYAS